MRITDRTSCSEQESCRLPPRSVTRRQQFAIDQPIKSQATFGNIVTAVFSAILREIGTKGANARFMKTERGKFAAKA
jgi:hypothetical protein